MPLEKNSAFFSFFFRLFKKQAGLEFFISRNIQARSEQKQEFARHRLMGL